MKRNFGKLLLTFLCGLYLGLSPLQADDHGSIILGKLKHPKNFPHFDFVNPNAPKGGRIVLGTFSKAFDSFNMFTNQGTPATGLGYVYDSLLRRSWNEVGASYGLIAEKIETDDTKTWSIYHIREIAKFHDGTPIRAEDVKFSLEAIQDYDPRYASYLGGIKSITVLSPLKVRFDYKLADKELTNIIGDIPITSKAYWEKHDLSKPSLNPGMGSGPYKIGKYEPTRYINYERNKDYWAKDLNVSIGLFNFDTIQYQYFRDRAVNFEAFKAGEFDFKEILSSKQWGDTLNISQVEKGLIKKVSLPNRNTRAMQGWAFNLRNPIFQDRRVREAITNLYDFEWQNNKLSYGLRERTSSYFEGSELKATGIPEGKELEILSEYKDQLPAELFEKEFKLPKTDGSGNIRPQLKRAKELLTEAGWEVVDGILTHKETGQKMEFTILNRDAGFNAITTPFVQNLEKLGIKATIKVIDVATWLNRMHKYDFDMTIHIMRNSLSPGNEQTFYWHSSSAKQDGNRNYMGVQDPVIDSLVERIVECDNREDLVILSRALDRVLMWNYYLVPHFHSKEDWFAFWDKFSYPEAPIKEHHIERWWYDETKAALLQDKIDGKVTTVTKKSDGQVVKNASEGNSNILIYGLLILLAIGGIIFYRARAK